jgi:rSAM/selenodomain-associated transferase 1
VLVDCNNCREIGSFSIGKEGNGAMLNNLPDIESSYVHSDGVMLIFSKAPVPGYVKTRLIPLLSAEQAAELHKRLTRFTIERALSGHRCPVQLWCTPDTQHPFFRQCNDAYPLTLHQQQGGGLGERMHHAFCEALKNYRYAVLTGCDCPSLQSEDLNKALAALQDGCDCVIAPAADGGYVLIGLNCPQASLFEQMPWGSEKILELTRNKAVSLSLRFNEFSVQWDVDVPGDLKKLRSLHGELLNGLV